MRFVASVLVAAAITAPLVRADDPAYRQTLDTYDIVWDELSKGAIDSMPLSGHNLGINVWVQDGDLLLLPGGSDYLDKNGMQVKLGLIRIRFDRPVFAQDFRQSLHLATGEIEVRGLTEDDKAVTVTLWCDAGKTIAHADQRSATPVGASIS